MSCGVGVKFVYELRWSDDCAGEGRKEYRLMG